MSSPSPTTTTTTHSSLGRRAGFPQAPDMKPFRVRWISSGLSRLAVVPAVLATALLMASSASAQLFTSTASTGNWANSTPSGTAGGLRWSTNSAGPYNTVYTNNTDTNFNTAGTYTFAKLVASGSATLGNITTVDNANIVFTDSASQVLNFGGAGGAVKALNFGAGSVVDFGSITTVAGNGINKTGAGTLMLTGGGYTGGFTLGAGNVIARGNGALGTGNVNIDGGAIGATTNVAFSARAGAAVIKVRSDFQLGTSETFNGAATNTSNISFTAAGTGFNLDSGARTITLGSNGSMAFGQVISNGSLTLNRLAGASGQFGLSAGNSMSALTLDSVTVNALTNNAALGAGTVTLQGANATTLNIQGARTIGNAFTIADSGGTKTITGNNNSGNITGTITNSDSTGGLTIGSIGATNFTVGVIDGAGTTGVTFGSSALLGTVTMSGASSYAGDTRIDSSTLKMSGAGAVPNGKLVFQGTGAATFDVNGTSQTVAKLDDSALDGVIKSSAVSGRLIVGDSTDSTFAGTIISGASLGLEKIGSGKLTLTGVNTYSGGTTITAGELEVNSLATQAITNNAVLTFNPDTNRTFAGVIGGSGAVTKIGSNDLTLTGANTYAGGTTVTAGNLIGTTDSLQGAIVNNATVTFRQSTAGTYAGVMSGGGALVKEGTGNVELTGLNTYNGGTTITGGVLTGSTDSLQGNIVADTGTTLAFNQATDGIYSGILSGAGALRKEGVGAVTLTGANTYTGGNTITEGNLIGSTTSILGATAVDSGATLTLNDTSAATFAGDITGAGALAKTGAGNVTLSGANTYTGGTTVSAGGLTGSIDNLQGDIGAAGGTTVTFNQGVDGAYLGVLSGAGKLIKDGAGILTVSGANTYSGNTEVLGGTLLGTTSNVRGNIAVSAGANVSFENTANGTVAGNVTGAGSLSVLAGEVTLAGTNTYSGGTTVLGGELKGTATSIQGAIVNDSAVSIDGAGTYAGVMSGAGSLTKTGAGDLTLTGANTYLGSTTVSGGNLIGTTTSLTGDITAEAGTLVKLSQTTDGTYAGAISGAGGLSKLGVGVVTLTQEQLYTGATNVDAGTLLLGGNLATSGITVANGATLGGSGATAGSANLIANGTLKPGVGATPGSLEAAGITLGSSNTTDLRLVADSSGDAGLAGIDYSTVIARSTLVYGGNLVIRFDNTNLYDNYSSFSLFSAATYDVSANGGQGFAGITVGGTGPYSGLTFTYNPSVGGREAIWVTGDTSSAQYMVFHPTSGTLVIVPEPSTWAMTLASVGFAGWMARRKKLASKKQRQLAA
ncbi:MAG: polymorphic outer membrane protein [Planctomycetota bacterium]